MKQAALTLTLAVVFCGCVKAPVRRDIQNSSIMNGSFDSVWTGLIETFSDLNIPIETIEKASGLLVARAMGRMFDNCDCGSPGMLGLENVRGQFNVFVKTVEGGTMVKVNLICEGDLVNTLSSSASSSPATCYSTGKLEAEIISLVRSKLGPTDAGVGS